MNGSSCNYPDSWKLEQTTCKNRRNKVKLNNLFFNSQGVPGSILVAEVDSGATWHWFSTNSYSILDNITQEDGPAITIPNNSKIIPTVTANLPLPHFSPAVTKTYLIKHIQDTNLFSLGQLCDNDYHVVLIKKRFYVSRNKQVLLQGFRNLEDDLWNITLQSPQTTLTHKLKALLFQQKHLTIPDLQNLPFQKIIPNINAKFNVIIHKDTIKIELAQFLHWVCFSPFKSTLITAVRKGNFISWHRSHSKSHC